jgi:hypothetical protein
MRSLILAFALVLAATCAPTAALAQTPQAVTISFPASKSAKPLDGRMFFLLSNDPSAEPRHQINDSPRTQIIFGTTVDGLAPDQPVTIDNRADGYPYRTHADVPPGD